MLLYYLSLIDSEEDKSKFEKIYEQYRLLMKYIALQVHDSFVKIIKHLDQVGDVYSHKTRSFIVIIVKNTAIDYIRKEKRSSLVDDIDKVYDTRATAVSGNITDDLSVREILAKLKELPEKYRDILELKVYHELSDKQIADILNLSHAAARKRLQRAREAFDALLNE